MQMQKRDGGHSNFSTSQLLSKKLYNAEAAPSRAPWGVQFYLERSLERSFGRGRFRQLVNGGRIGPPVLT